MIAPAIRDPDCLSQERGCPHPQFFHVEVSNADEGIRVLIASTDQGVD
jgi:hypothetical protein